MSPWTFLTNHALVLRCIAEHPRSTAGAIADAVGVTERTVRKIIADLDAEGYIQHIRQGRRNLYSVNTTMPLRHSTQGNVAVGELLAILVPPVRVAVETAPHNAP